MATNLKEDIHKILKKYWSFDSFRTLQEEIILSVVEGKDTLALLPTGGGKSICFQIPGLLSGGTTLVISPLISLMNDQVANLRKRGISAASISSAMTKREIDIAFNNAALGHVQFLYISPERLQSEDFRQKLSYLPITLLAVDEAHCISQWGFDFRPSYRSISEVRDLFEKIPVVALTASATKKVVDDIQEQLKFKGGNVFRQSFARKNLRYVVQQEENKYERLLKLINNVGGSGIVYTRNRKRTEETAAFLTKNKMRAKAYHAGMKYDERQEVQNDWIENKVGIICATNAFGMGIDKPDVRYVVHLDLPDSLEAYFQEAGRAGRDGKNSFAVIFCTESDRQKLLDNVKISFPEPEEIRRSYKAICNYFQIALNSGENAIYDFEIEKICASYNLQAITVYNSMKFLEKEGYLSLSDAGFEESKVFITSRKEELYEFQVKFPKHEPLIKTLLRSYGGLMDGYVHVSEKKLAQRAKTSTAEVTNTLQLLDKHNILSYFPQTGIPKIIFLRNRVKDEYLQISHENYQRLKDLHEARVNSVIDYSKNNDICRQIQLLTYFNEFDFSDCGHCDVCLAKKPKDLGKAKTKLKTLLSERHLKLDQLKTKMTIYKNESWIQALNELVDDGVVEEGEEGYFLK
jgi:ATP-dependent DNA helicase RecQ